VTVLVAALAPWCVVAGVVALLIGGTIRIRDGQIPHA